MERVEGVFSFVFLPAFFLFPIVVLILFHSGILSHEGVSFAILGVYGPSITICVYVFHKAYAVARRNSQIPRPEGRSL